MKADNCKPLHYVREITFFTLSFSGDVNSSCEVCKFMMYHMIV